MKARGRSDGLQPNTSSSGLQPNDVQNSNLYRSPDSTHCRLPHGIPWVAALLLTASPLVCIQQLMQLYLRCIEVRSNQLGSTSCVRTAGISTTDRSESKWNWFSCKALLQQATQSPFCSHWSQSIVTLGPDREVEPAYL